jgi:8-oxo-dGTP pyrophosphatase MutT (NUDIX family)
MAKTLTHAGGVAFRARDDQTLYLVVSSSDGANWVLPKGHIEPGESPEAAALRELQEEAGVIGEIVEKLSAQQFEKGKEAVRVQYFLIRELASITATENRTLRWEDERSALELLTFAEARAALREGAAVGQRLEKKQ